MAKRIVSQGCLDLVVAGYEGGGSSVATQGRQGHVCFWSPRNLLHRTRTWTAPCGVSALAASHKSSSLLAVGLCDGSLRLHELANLQVGDFLLTP